MLFKKGRIVPCMLVGEGARIWAREQNLEEVTDDYLKTGNFKLFLILEKKNFPSHISYVSTVTENMIKSHHHYMKKLNMLTNDLKTKQSDDPDLNGNLKSTVTDSNQMFKPE